ncbi:DUF6153 family protein [Streptomyces sp. NPDC048362]|uniref:DUF6153 family protein n=1 Tax=unclassified Streptomyces TaxID=2593676 RepID=UPI0033EE262C
MPSTRQHPRRPPRRRHRALSVLAVLIGLLGMHALAPGGGTGHPGHHPPSAHVAVALDAMGDCFGGDARHGGDRMRHADPTCASGAVDDGPRVPDPGAAPVTASAPADDLGPCAVTTPDGARAPPTLAELQLLRI